MKKIFTLINNFFQRRKLRFATLYERRKKERCEEVGLNWTNKCDWSKNEKNILGE